ncbi:MAG: efflux RND transporter periplasmic adaptor subunit [marine benthic group bacterium]|nr:efflux RND transporter periplasmic adaptor subunit [Candidatus Carthagonibacter metallireducens]
MDRKTGMQTMAMSPVNSALRRIGVIAGTLPVLALSACGGDDGPARLAPEVTVSQPVVRPVRPFVDFTGTTRAIESVEIRARIGGVLREQRFQPSEIVDENQVLFVIEPEQYQAARDEAAALLNSAIADSALKESNLERVQIAIETNAVSKQDLDRAQAERDAAVASVLGARARLSRAQLDFDYTRVRTPITGQVGRRLVDPGNLVGYGEQTLLTTVNRIQPIHVFFNAPEWVVLAMLRAMEEAQVAEAVEGGSRTVQGQKKEVVEVLVGTAADADSFPIEGYVDFVGNTVDPSTGTIEIRAEFDNEDLDLFPGLFVRVRVLGVEARDEVLVSERAVGTDLGGKYVYRVGEDNVVERVYVTVGQPQPDGTIVVEEGIGVDDTYISNGLLRARPGLPVTPLTEVEMAQRQAAMAQQAGAAGQEGAEPAEADSGEEE